MPRVLCHAAMYALDQPMSLQTDERPVRRDVSSFAIATLTPLVALWT